LASSRHSIQAFTLTPYHAAIGIHTQPAHSQHSSQQHQVTASHIPTSYIADTGINTRHTRHCGIISSSHQPCTPPLYANSHRYTQLSHIVAAYPYHIIKLHWSYMHTHAHVMLVAHRLRTTTLSSIARPIAAASCHHNAHLHVIQTYMSSLVGRHHSTHHYTMPSRHRHQHQAHSRPWHRIFPPHRHSHRHCMHSSTGMHSQTAPSPNGVTAQQHHVTSSHIATCHTDTGKDTRH
jgi:hypothetical protein